MLVGPGETPVVPYGSFYLSPTRNLMTEETMGVRAMYLDAGMAVQPQPVAAAKSEAAPKVQTASREQEEVKPQL